MFASYMRAAVNLAFAVLLAAILGFVLQFFIPMMGPEETLLRRSFESLHTWMLFLMIAAVLASVLFRSVIEGRLAEVRP